MLYYIIHQSPLWKGLSNGKRNVRILIIVLCLYIIIRALSYEFKDSNLLFKILDGYFWWFLLADFFGNACNYKLYYGRNIMEELNPLNEDTYDKKTHKYKRPKFKKQSQIKDESCAQNNTSFPLNINSSQNNTSQNNISQNNISQHNTSQHNTSQNNISQNSTQFTNTPPSHNIADNITNQNDPPMYQQENKINNDNYQYSNNDLDEIDVYQSKNIIPAKMS